jgi:catalase
VTELGPIAGRKIGIIADAGADLAGIAGIRKAAAKLGATALVIAPVGGVLGSGARKQTVDRTLLTTRWSSSTPSSWPAAPPRPATSS